MEKQEQEENQLVIPVKIIREKKQLSVRFPKAIENRFDINPKKDRFAWVIEGERKISLKGIFIKNEE